MANSAAAPAQQSNANQSAIMSALSNLVSGMGQASAPLATDVGGYGTYMSIGQNATQLQDQATKINNSSGGLLGGLGSLLSDAGTAAGDYAAFAAL